MEFLAMGGYGFYVWGSYGMTALVLTLELLSLRARRRRAVARVRSGGFDHLAGSVAEAVQ